MNEIEQAINAFSSFVKYCERIGATQDSVNDKLALLALQEKVERDKEQSECKYCNANYCWGCEYAGECTTVEHCRSNDRVDYKAQFNHCHICGRDLRRVKTDG